MQPSLRLFDFHLSTSGTECNLVVQKLSLSLLAQTTDDECGRSSASGLPYICRSVCAKCFLCVKLKNSCLPQVWLNAISSFPTCIRSSCKRFLLPFLASVAQNEIKGEKVQVPPNIFSYRSLSALSVALLFLSFLAVEENLKFR